VAEMILRKLAGYMLNDYKRNQDTRDKLQILVHV